MNSAVYRFFLLVWLALSIKIMISVDIDENLSNILKASQDYHYSKLEHPQRCEWYDIRSSIYGLQSRKTPVYVQTSCISMDSLGNDFSNYIESILCAEVSGLHFVAAPKTLHREASNHSFYKALPGIIPHISPVTYSSQLNEKVSKLCPCQSMCHEWSHGLMHARMVKVGHIFRLAVDSYWSSVGNLQQYLNLDAARSRVPHKFACSLYAL